MSFSLFVLYIAEHYIAVVGTTLALFFTTCMILLIRSIGNRSESEDGGVVDVTAIEGALKRVLATQPISISARSGDGITATSRQAGGASESTTDDGRSIETLQLSVQASEAQIEKLSKELADARAAASAASGDAANSGLQDELKIYKVKIEELQARLAEYEIIEDDIADLSMFKEENAKLKEELALLKAKPQLGAASSTAPLEPEAQHLVIPSFEKADTLALDPEDDVVKQFSAAVEATSQEATVPTPLKPASPPEPEQPRALAVASEDPLAGDLNTSKIISEVESLTAAVESAAAADSGSALEDLLDTDKLLAEVDSLKGASSDLAPEDDLLATFDKKAAEG